MGVTEWTVFGVIAALATFVITVVSPIVKLNTTIAKMTEVVDKCAADLEKLTERNAQTHQRIFEQLGDHETRITVLESKGDEH